MRKIITLILAGALTLSMGSMAFAADYEFESEESGATFYQVTSTSEDHIATSPDIVVGMDGTIGNEPSQVNPSSAPFSAVNVAVGEYPLAYSEATDISIAQNSYFINELGPTYQTRNIYTPMYQNVAVSSGALPLASEVGMLKVGTVIPSGVAEGTKLGSLSIPAVSLSANVYEGETTAQMLKGAAHFSCTPVWGGNVAFAGHNRGGKSAYFSALKDVDYGDLVYYTTAYGTRTYQVTQIKTVATTDTTGLLQDGTEKLTMYTCKMNQPDVKLCVVASLVY